MTTSLSGDGRHSGGDEGGAGATTSAARIKRELRRNLGAALPAWLTARALVLVAFVLAHPLFSALRPDTSGRLRLRQGLLAWDGEWFHRIASDGYAALPRPSLRYFPLLPMLGRGLSTVLGGNVGLALILLANAFALAAGALLYRLALRETGEEPLARRSAWLLALAPPSFVLVMAYTESLAIFLAVATFLALRQGRWGWAALAGFLSGLARPLGVLLAVPALVEVVRQLRQAPWRERMGGVAAVAAPLAGCSSYLVWVWVRFGDPLLPYSVQQTSAFRGRLANPLVTLVDTAQDFLSGRFATKNVPHLPWAIVLVALVVVACRRWPASYGVFAALTVGVALSTERLGSLERYGFACFPVILALASLAVGTGRRERLLLVVSGGLMAVYATLTFMAVYVP